MKVYNTKTKTLVDDYIGWYIKGSGRTQNVYLHVSGNGSVYMHYDTDPNNSNLPIEVYYDLTLRFLMPFDVYAMQEEEKIIKNLQPIIDRLVESYEETFDQRNNHKKGLWNQEVIEELQEAVEECETDLAWDWEGDFKENEQE